MKKAIIALGYLLFLSTGYAQNITGSGTSYYIPKFTGSSTIGISEIYQNGTSIGIGFTSPSQKLEINGNILISGTAPLLLTGTGSGTYTKSVIYNNTTDNFLIDLARLTESSGGTPINFKIDARGGGANFFYINGSNGNTGVGTSSPQKRAHVAAYATSSQLRLERTGSSVGYTDIGSDNAGLKFFIGGDDGNPEIIITSGGNLLVNKTTSTYKLDVGGGIRADSVIVNTSGADFVFNAEYTLPSLDEVEKYVLQNKHLPGVPSAEKMQSEGVSIGALQTTLLQKIEELTLYVIQLNKENRELKNILNNKSN